jgi:mycothiol synthase
MEEEPPADVGTILATITEDAGGSVGGRAVVTAGNRSSNVSIDLPDGDGDRPARTRALLGAALEAVVAHGGGEVHWWVQGATEQDEAIAAGLGLAPGRLLLRLERSLPTGFAVEIETREFRPGVDEAAWIRQNNRSFADHPEQGGWTLATLARQEAEPWFDPAGFLLHEQDGRLAGSCWTKLHPASDEDPPMGEIYVIGVDPDFQGLGLGRQLTLAGLTSIEDRGIDRALLYVDAANIPAVTMYDRLGFELRRTDQAFTAVLTSASTRRS